MESQPQNPEFRNNPENFHPCILPSSNAIDKNLSTPKRSFLPAYFEIFIKKYRCKIFALKLYPLHIKQLNIQIRVCTVCANDLHCLHK